MASLSHLTVARLGAAGGVPGGVLAAQILCCVSCAALGLVNAALMIAGSISKLRWLTHDIFTSVQCLYHIDRSHPKNVQ